MTDQLQTIDQMRQTAVDLALRFGPKLLVALLLLVAGLVVAQWIGGLAERGLGRFRMEPPVRQLLVRIVRVLVIGLFGIMALQNLGVELLPLIAGLGVAGAGVALAMQGVLGNLVAGFTVIFTKPFAVGEYISIAGEEGQVETISLSSTVLSHADRSRIVIPNRKIVGEILHNYGRLRQLSIDVAVAPGADIDAALQALDEALRASPQVLKDPVPVIAVALRPAGGIGIAVKPWVAVPDYGSAGSAVARAIIAKLRERKVALPMAPGEVRLLGGEPTAPV